MQDKIMTTLQVLDVIKNHDIAIYGTGFVAKNFYTALQLKGLNDRIRCFVVTDEQNVGGVIQGVPIRGAREVLKEKDIYICIAVHEAIKDEIEKKLLDNNFEKYIWIYPNLMELLFGMPLERHKKMEVKKILEHQKNNNYNFAIGYLAIENYYNKNDKGYDIYIKAMALMSEEATAKKRLMKFISLIDDWDKNGYRRNVNLLIDQENRLIDGNHRFTLAIYHQVPEIYCDIFSCSDIYNKTVRKLHFETLEELKRYGFVEDELEMLQNAQNKILQL